MAFTDSIKWNGKSLRDYFAEITEIKGRGKPRVNVKGISIPGRHGQIAFGQTYKPRIIEIEGTVEGSSHADLMSNIDDLKSLFAMEDVVLSMGNRTISDGMEYGKLEFGDEPDRYYSAIFDGLFDLPEISHRWMNNDIKRFRARFRCDEPFAVASALSEATMAGSVDEFKTFPTGTAHNDSIIEVKGSATDPVLIEGDKAAIAHFDYNDNLSDVTLAEVTGNFTNLFGYRSFKDLSSRQSKGIQIVRKDNLYYDRGTQINGKNYTNINPHQGTIIFWIKPYFDGGDSKNHNLFDHFKNSNDSILLNKTGGNNIQFNIRFQGSSRAANVAASGVVAGTWIMIVGRWDSNNTIDASSNFVQVDLMGVSEGGNASSLTTVMTPADFIAIGQQYTTTPDGSTNIFDGLIFHNIFERALTDSELDDIYNSGAGVEPFVTPDTKLLSVGELSSGDPVSVQYPWVDNKFTDGDQENDPAAEWGDSGATVTVTNESTIVKYDTQSAQIDFVASPINSYANRDTVMLVNDQDYFYRFWIYASALSASDPLYLDIVGNSTVHTRQLNTGTDDLGVSYTTGTWLYFEGTFEADGAVAHEFRIRKEVDDGNATIYIDQMDCQVNLVDNAGLEGTYAAGLAPGWALRNTPTVAEENTIVHSGGASQKITGTGFFEGVAKNVTLAADTWYMQFIWARGAVGGEEFNLLIADLTDVTYVPLVVDLTISWKKYYILFRTGSDTSGQFRVFMTDSGDTIYVDDAGVIELDTVTANAASEATPEFDSYSQERFGQGLQLDGGDTLSWNITANKDEGSIVVWLKPMFGSVWTDNDHDAIFCEAQYDANNFLRLFYDGQNGKIIFRKRVSGTDHDAEFSAPVFNAGETICLAGTYGAGGVKIYLNGIVGSVTNSNLSALGGNPTTLFMSDAAQTLFPDAIVDELYLYSRELSEVEALKYSNSATAVKNGNAKFSMTKVLSEGDRLLLDSKKQSVEFFDKSTGTLTNAVASMDIGSILPKFESNRAVIYNKSANGGLNIKYRKRWL